MELSKDDVVSVDGGIGTVHMISPNGNSVLLTKVSGVRSGRFFALHPTLGRVLVLLRVDGDRFRDLVSDEIVTVSPYDAQASA